MRAWLVSGIGPAEEEDEDEEEKVGGTGRRRGNSFVGNGIVLEVEVAVEALAGCFCPPFQRTRALLVDLFDQVAEEREEDEEDF